MIVAAGLDVATHCRAAAWIGTRLARLPPIASVVRFDSARFGCLDGSCGLVADLSGVQFTLPDGHGIRFQAGRVHYCPKGGVEIQDGVLHGTAPFRW